MDGLRNNLSKSKLDKIRKKKIDKLILFLYKKNIYIYNNNLT